MTDEKPYLTISHGQTFTGLEICQLPEPIRRRLQQFSDDKRQQFTFGIDTDTMTYNGCDTVIP